MFKYLSRFDNVTFSGHKFMENALNHDRIFLKALNDECSTCYVVAEGIIPNIKYFNLLQGSAIHVFLAEKPNLDLDGCSLYGLYGNLGGNWPLDRAWFFTSLYYRVYKLVRVCQQGIAHACTIDLICKMNIVCK